MLFIGKIYPWLCCGLQNFDTTKIEFIVGLPRRKG